MTDIHRAQRWKQFYEEECGLKDMLADIRNTYYARMAQLDGDKVPSLHRLAIAAEATKQLDNYVQAIIAGGLIEVQRQEMAERIEKFPAAERDIRKRWIW